jgi:hypothetical protein
MLLFASGASGASGAMLAGGISSRLPSVAGPRQRSQRRGQSWDVARAPAFGGAAAAGTPVAAYGIGNLLGSAGLMLRPLRRDAAPLMSSLAALVAATLILVKLYSDTPHLPHCLLSGRGR